MQEQEQNQRQEQEGLSLPSKNDPFKKQETSPDAKQEEKKKTSPKRNETTGKSTPSREKSEQAQRKKKERENLPSKFPLQPGKDVADKNGLDSFFSKVNDRKARQQNPNANGSEQPTEQEASSTNEDGKETVSKEQDGTQKESILDTFEKRSLLGRMRDFARKSVLEEDTPYEQEQEVSSKIASSIKGALKGLIALPTMLPILLIAVLLSTLLVTTVTTTTTATTVDSYSIDYLLGEKLGEPIVGIEVDEDMYTEEQVAFVNRILAVYNEYKEKNLLFDAHLISATQFVIQQYNKDFTYNEMSNSVIRELVDLMFKDNLYDQETFTNNLISRFFPEYAGNTDVDLYEDMTEEIYQYIEDYRALVIDPDYQAPSLGGTCTYVAPGVNINGSRRSHAINASNIQVQLMQTGSVDGHAYGGTYGEKMDTAPIPFEDYTAGVVYQEVGPAVSIETLRAQNIAARSYSLARPFDMGGWRKLAQENGQWMLYLAGSTADQVYCSLEYGCSSNKTTSGSDACQWGMIYPGTNHGTVCKEPLATDHALYQVKDEMAGKVLVDSEGYIIYAGYKSGDQENWEDLAKSGYDYTQILLSYYAERGASEIKQMACTAKTDTSELPWKQSDSRWGSIPLSPSSKTLGQVGCLVTSLAMMVQKSGVATTIQGEFNPGTFAQALIRLNTFNSNGALLDFNNVTQIAPQLQVVESHHYFGGTRAFKTETIKRYLDEGYYVIAQVTGPETDQHFVYVDSCDGENVSILDPGYNHTSLWEAYDTGRLVIFKKG